MNPSCFIISEHSFDLINYICADSNIGPYGFTLLPINEYARHNGYYAIFIPGTMSKKLSKSNIRYDFIKIKNFGNLSFKEIVAEYLKRHY